jgi:hexosaminidase
VGAWRDKTLIGHYFDEPRRFEEARYGGFYTQDEVRDIVAYAAARFITVVPEIELPGHATAVIAAYPELGNSKEIPEILGLWGVHDRIFNPEAGTVAFLRGVFEEVLGLFPSTFIHVGGDEVPKREWQESERAQARMRDLGLDTEDELQSHFIREMDRFLSERGRRLIGWDEILEGGLAEGATVMSWRGEAGGIEAALAGHDVVMAPGTHTYLDHYQSEDKEREPLAIHGFTPLEKAYSYEPIPHGLGEEAARHVLGAQAQLWTEYIATTRGLEYMLFPRLSALAEVFWSPASVKEYSSFLARLKAQLERFDASGVHYRTPEALR